MKKIILRFRAVDKDNFNEIKDGLKTVETRAATIRYTNIQKGDVLVIVCGKQRINKEVKRVRQFKTIESMFKAIPFKKIMPSIHSADDARKIYYSYPGYKAKIKKSGLVAWDLNIKTYDTKIFLSKLRELIARNGDPVSDILITHGNFDDSGNLIKTGIPTLTTNLCEIGIHKDDLYFVFIVNSNTYNKTLFDSLKIFNNIKIYAFKNFKTTLYPASGFVYKSFEKEITKEKYLQIQFNYDLNVITLDQLYKEYQDIKDVLENNKTMVINQLEKIKSH